MDDAYITVIVLFAISQLTTFGIIAYTIRQKTILEHKLCELHEKLYQINRENIQNIVVLPIRAVRNKED